MRDLQEEINRLRQKFRILKDWEITLNAEAKYKCQCIVNAKKRTAVIYDWHEGEAPKDYIFHELMHICLRVIHHPQGFRRDAEEKFVQDLSDMFTKEC